MQEYEKIVCLDFCGTVANYQTFDPFVEFILKGEGIELPKRESCAINKIVSKCIRKIMTFVNRSYTPYKLALIRKLKGISKSKIEEYGKRYYEEVVKCAFIPETLELVQELQQQGCLIYLVSAGGSDYLRYFANEFNVPVVLAVEFEYYNDVCTGRISGTDMLGANKVIELEKLLGGKIERDTFACGISDSISDMPMLNLCKRKVIISNKRHQQWVDSTMEEILCNF